MSMKWVDLENRSTITQIESNLGAVNGKLIMESMLISTHFYYGICSGFNSPPGFV
jgi:hypothetical protein